MEEIYIYIYLAVLPKKQLELTIAVLFRGDNEGRKVARENQSCSREEETISIDGGRNSKGAVYLLLSSRKSKIPGSWKV